jgi:hypothetical protein
VQKLTALHVIGIQHFRRLDTTQLTTLNPSHLRTHEARERQQSRTSNQAGISIPVSRTEDGAGAAPSHEAQFSC